MKNLLSALVVSSVLAGCASLGGRISDDQRLAMYRAAAGEPVDSLQYYGRLQSWTPISDEALVVRVGPNRSYLLEMLGTCPDLDFAHSIALSSQFGRVYSRFDTVRVIGGATGHNIPCRIEEIRPVDTSAVREAEREFRESIETTERGQDSGGT